MKRGMMGKLFFVSILLIFLSSGVFALPYGTCNITLSGFCDSSQGYIIMGLSAATNAHGQATIPAPNPVYPYVVCCNFGTGNLACTNSPQPNKIIGLSSLTNAHAEIPSLNNYQTVKICYEDLQCIGGTDACGKTGSPVESYKLNFTSISSTTNAHIGAINDFPIKICCKSAAYLSQCTLKSAKWNTQTAIDGQRVYLIVNGSGIECDGDTLSFQILGGAPVGSNNVTSVAFSGDIAIASWNASYQSGNPSFYFNATLVQNPTQTILSSDPKLTVSNTQIIDWCATNGINSCSDYSTQDKCTPDICNITKNVVLPGVVDCRDHNKAFCGCSWDSNANTCGFSYNLYKSPLCENGTTLCQQSSTGLDYCYPGNTCLPGDIAPSDGNNICNANDSCASDDCKIKDPGQQGSCVTGATCLNGACNLPGAVPKNATCNYGYTLCRVFSTNYCYPGNKCPTGQYPTNNSNAKCGIGYGCLSSNCNEGNRDSCSSDTFCVSGMCGSALNPINLPSLGGQCHITQTIIKDCNVEPTGKKIINWTGTWTGTDTSGDAYNNCIAGGGAGVVVECPAQIQLPFDLSVYGIAITLVIVALIYFFLIFRKKKNSKAKKKQKR
jgi:hypothetical protein